MNIIGSVVFIVCISISLTTNALLSATLKSSTETVKSQQELIKQQYNLIEKQKSYIKTLEEVLNDNR